MSARAHLCSKKPFSCNKDIFNERFAHRLNKFSKIFWYFSALDEHLQYLTKQGKVLQNFTALNKMSQ